MWSRVVRGIFRFVACCALAGFLALSVFVGAVFVKGTIAADRLISAAIGKPPTGSGDLWVTLTMYLVVYSLLGGSFLFVLLALSRRRSDP